MSGSARMVESGNTRGMTVWLMAVALMAGRVHALDTTPPNVTCNDTTTHPVFVNSFFGLSVDISYTYEDANPDPSGVTYNVTTGAAGDLFPPGRTPVTLIAVDLLGNTATCLFYVENILTELPVNCPDLNQTVPTDSGQPTYSYTPTFGPGDVTKNKAKYRYHGDVVSVDSVIAAGTALGVGSHLDTLIIYDDVLNKTCSGYIVVQDTERPNVTCPENITESSTNVIEYSATAIDNVGPTLVYQPGLGPGDRFDPGLTLVTVIAQDQAGLSDTCYFSVEITLTELPVECPDDSTIQLDSSQSTYQYQPLTIDNLTLMDETYQFYGDVTIDVMTNGTYDYRLSVGTYSLTIVIDDTVLNKTCSSVIRVRLKERDDQPLNGITELPVECPDDSTIQLDSSQSTYQYQPLTIDNLTLMDETYQFYGDVTIDVMINGTYDYRLSVGTYALTIVIDDTVLSKTCSSVIRVGLKERDDQPVNRSPISTAVIVIVTCGAVLIAVFVIGCIVYQVKKTNKRGKKNVSEPGEVTMNKMPTITN